MITSSDDDIRAAIENLNQRFSTGLERLSLDSASSENIPLLFNEVPELNEYCDMIEGNPKANNLFLSDVWQTLLFVLPTVLRHVSHLILIKSSHAKRREDWIDGHRFETDKLTSCETRGKNTKRHFFFHIPCIHSLEIRSYNVY